MTAEIKIFTTGGTIDKIYFDQQSKYQVGDPQISEVLKEANVAFSYEVEPILQKDSLDLTDADRSLICDTVAHDSHKHCIITHGTDTMIVTAKALQHISGKTIVLTGSMSPAKFRNTDAVFNIGCAVAAVQILPEGVYISMNGRVFKPDRLSKNRELMRFKEE